ncbi:MAG: hypothetical protein ACREFD_14610 [Stellaceae bacterium]
MTRTLTAALAVLALAGGAFAVAPAMADSYSSTTTVTKTSPVFGYHDGYWTESHTWHPWASPGARVHFQRTYHSHYYSGMHSHYAHKGWREHDTWWSSH